MSAPPTIGVFLEAWKALTPRQREVVQLRCKGNTNKEIGAATFVSEQTAKNHMTSAFLVLCKALGVEHVSNAASKKSVVVCWHLGYFQATVHAIQRRRAEHEADSRGIPEDGSQTEGEHGDQPQH